jgi:NTP pyrophosphatase (non-canonical NTP hydrolase)
MMNDLLSKDNLGLKEPQVFPRELLSACRKHRKANQAADVVETRHQVGDELADCLAYGIKMANYAEVDLNAAYLNKRKRNLTREWHPNIR